MDEVENQSVNQEIATPKTETHEAQQVPESREDDSSQDRNWREIRRKNKALEQELEMQRQMMARLMAQQPQAPAQPQEIDEFDQIGDDEYIPKGKVSRLVEKRAEKIARQIAQQEVEKTIRQRDESRYLEKLRSQYSDFDDVVNSDTLALLEETDPELAVTIVESKDPYKMGVQSYKYIKALNLSDKVPGKRRTREVEKKLEANAKTVQTPQAYEKRPMAQAFRLTNSEKNDLYKEMMGYASHA